MKNFTKQNFKTNPLWIRLLIMTFMLLAGAGSVWSANLYIYSTSSSAKAWIWVEGGSNYTGGNWNSRPALSNTTYFESLGNNIYRYKKETLPSKVSIILTPSGGSPEARIDNLSLSSDKYLSYSGGSSITQVTRPTNRYVAGSTAGDTGGTDNVFGTRWEANGSTNKMTWDASKCLFVKEYITNETSPMTLTFKITDGTWSNSWPSSNKTQTVSSGCRITTITFNIFTNAVSSTSASSTACCTTVNAPNVTADAICAGNSATLKLTNRQTGVTYKLNSTSGTTIFSSGDTYTTSALNANTTYKIYASHASACTNNVEGSVTVTVNPTPSFTTNPTNKTMCAGETSETNLTTLSGVVVANGSPVWYNAQTDGSTVAKADIVNGGTYWVAAENSTTGCKNTTRQKFVLTVNPTPSFTTNPTDKTMCAGETSETNLTTLSGVVVANGSPVWYNAQTGGSTVAKADIVNGGTYWVAAENSTTGCKNATRKKFVLAVKSAPTTPSLSADRDMLNTTNTTATLTIGNYVSGVTYTLYKGENSTGKTTTETTFTVTEGGIYKVKGTNTTNPSACQDTEFSKEVIISTCPTVATPTLSIVSEPKNNCGTETKGKIQITNYSSFSDCTFTLNGSACKPSSNGEIEVSESGTYNVVAINDCGSKSTAGSVTVSKTTITAPSTTPEVSLSYPQVAFATNDGSVNINLSIGERGITYYLYKDGAQVANSEKTGENKSLQWTVNESGTYTVKAPNPCDGGYIAMTGSVKYTCMSNLKLAFDGGKSVFCPGETTNIIVTFDGDGKGDEITNYGKYGWQWEKTNIDYTSVYLSESGVKVPVTIKGDGSIKLGVRSCGTIYSNELTFTVHKAPEAPTVSFSPNPVGQNINTTLSIASYSADNTYVVYKSEDDKVGSDTKVADYTAPFAISLADVDNYYYYAVATSKACTGLVTTSTITKLEVLEAGAKIDALGATALFTNDPTHFIPMYVEKDGIVDVEGATKVDGYTWEFSEDGSSEWTACNYTYANFNAKNNKSQHQVVVTNGNKDCNNWRANAVGYYRCKMTYDNGASQYSNSIQVTAGTNSNTNKQHIGITYNLPIISVNTGDKDFPSDASLSGYPSASADDLKKKRSVDVKIFNPDGTVCYDRKARMAYRGSSSLNFQKKSYAFCPGKAKCGDEEKSVDYVKTSKENLFGLSNGAEDKDWVLYAATPEPSMMRNRLTFDLYKEMRPQDWGVNSMYVELVINGEYKGVYVLMDKITQNKNRVKLSSADAFIVKFDKTDCVDRIGGYNGKVGDEKTFITSKSGKFGIDTYDTKVDQAFEIEYPEKEDFEDVNVGSWKPFTDKVKEKFEQFETALEKKDYTTVRSIIDYDSWADWFILTEFIKNQDGFRASNIFVYDGDKIEARPLWDQELSFKNKARIAHSCDNAGGLLVTTSSIYEDNFKAPFWFTGGNNSITGGLLSDPCFVSLVKQKWAEYSIEGGILTKTHIESKVSAYDSELGAAQSREAARWPYTGAVRGMTNNGKTIGYYGKNEGIEIGYADSKSDILSWANGRVGGLTTALNGLEGEALIFTMTPSVEITPWQIGIINIHAPAGYTYTVDFSQVENAGGYVSNDNATYSVKLPRPADWAIGGNGSTTLSKTYTVTAKLELDSEENTCGFTSTENTKDSVITLKDETEECDSEVTR